MSAARPPPAWGLLLGLALAKLCLHALSSWLVGYGYSADELYFLDCADHLAWGYVDHPPFSIAALWLVRGVVGDSLVALRLAAALAGTVGVIITGLMARELGGGRAAQGLAALAAIMSPVLLFTTGYYSMNAIDFTVWTVAAYLLLRLLNDADPRLWLMLGVVLGIGLLNKWSTLWFGIGLAAGLLATRRRRWLLTPWPWLCALIAATLWLPNLVWQMHNDWPTVEFMRNGMRDVMVAKPPLAFMREQFRAMHPVLALFGVGGLVYAFASPHGRPYRLLAWLWLGVFAVLMMSGSARPYYLAPAYPIIFALGGVAVERVAQRPRWKWLAPATAALIVLSGAVSAPLALPLLPPDTFIAYERALGMSRPQLEFDEGLLPPQFGFQFGWRELTDAVATAFTSLSPEERKQAGILTHTFGETAALNFFGRGLLPPAIGTHNSYWLWGPGPHSGTVMLIVCDSAAPLHEWFEEVTPLGNVACEYCMPVLRRRTIYRCRAPRRPLPELWRSLKDFS